ncbi:hypothetical protein [Kutzneria buriramensis]|uniref:Uncharacterized protein n=1 Tax=Kutzneria buriramensis TaxID=1045776 RepID=A0A3E0GV09_9PSEU|nr:hypothetical protein [Kutzneria buriramensis]REH28588.1 hypothetical protein BCF44_12630 [Kutzneria buriramensis]
MLIEKYANQASEPTPCDMPTDVLPISCAFFERAILVAANVAANGDGVAARAALAAYRAGHLVDAYYRGGLSYIGSLGRAVTHDSDPMSVHDLLDARIVMW